MFLSIIIPALNEEKYVGALLESIKKQPFTPYEVILADAGSTDKTKEIAANYGAKVVQGGMPGPGRNSGAKNAQGDFLLFLDADVVLPDNFLQNAFSEIEENFYDLATCAIEPDSGLGIDKAIYHSFSLYMRLNSLTNPVAAGSCIFITRRLFERIGGFDSKVTLAEDFDLVKRASHFRPLHILKSVNVIVSVRRLEKEGRITFVKKALVVGLYRTLFGEIHDNRFKYEFANFSITNEATLAKQLRKIDNFIIKLEQSYKNRKYLIEHKKKFFKILIEKMVRKFQKIFIESLLKKIR